MPSHVRSRCNWAVAFCVAALAHSQLYACIRGVHRHEETHELRKSMPQLLGHDAPGHTGHAFEVVVVVAVVVVESRARTAH